MSITTSASFPQRIEKRALIADTVGYRPVERKRVAAAGLDEPAQQNVVVGVDADQLGGDAGLRPQFAQPSQQRVGCKVTRAAIDADGERPITRLGLAQQQIEQKQRQIVEHLISEIFERLERGGKAGPRHAGDQDEAARGRFAVHVVNRSHSTAAFSAKRSLAMAEH